jgi:hypothetical protein
VRPPKHVLFGSAFGMGMKLSAHHSDFWPGLSAHRECWEHRNCPLVYEYDPTDDGPEIVARFILASHTLEELQAERRKTEARHVGHIWSRYHL